MADTWEVISGYSATDYVDTDTTLTIAGKPADSKKTGDEISQIKEDLQDLLSRVTALEG